MPQITLARSLIIGLFVLVASGCGDTNPDATFDSETGQHLANWSPLTSPLTHTSAGQADLDTCTDCHGQDFEGGISGVTCRNCHINTNGTLSCSQCHSYPETAPAHTPHRLPNVSCLDCHVNTVGTSSHNSGFIDVELNAAYNAASGTATFAGSTCSGASCHGGQTTPSWTTGGIDVATQCDACHAFNNGEYNTYASGEHDKHVNDKNYACTACHDPARLAGVHFNGLNTPGMEQAAATFYANLDYPGNWDECSTPCH